LRRVGVSLRAVVSGNGPEWIAGGFQAHLAAKGLEHRRIRDTTTVVANHSDYMRGRNQPRSSTTSSAVRHHDHQPRGPPPRPGSATALRRWLPLSSEPARCDKEAHVTALINKAEVVQNCYVVRDLEEACRRLNLMYGIGPFVGGQDGVLTAHTHRGHEEEPIRIRGAFVQSGELNIELVQLVSTTPSAFHDVFPDGQEGLHHVAVFTDDYAKVRDAFVAAGYPVASEFTALAKQICYIDTRDPLGHMIELYPPHKTIRAMYQMTRDAAADWDGAELIIPWDLTRYEVE
jgi:Glyoxalase/Bleomycin resistance protein/Dioxygenase superfamily